MTGCPCVAAGPLKEPRGETETGQLGSGALLCELHYLSIHSTHLVTYTAFGKDNLRYSGNATNVNQDCFLSFKKATQKKNRHKSQMKYPRCFRSFHQ